ncbi:transmembrane protein 254-like isoform X2 [Saccopteryx bilineata]|uniref:transmembrane protein 254-like isoform X2 n=1 Tax=Saccopteryx bilineata TaxID=59482 RepID=UPI0033903E8C
MEAGRSAREAPPQARPPSPRLAVPGCAIQGCAAAMAAAADDEAYFQRGSLFWLTVITLSFGYYTWVVFWPQSVPYENLGPLGSFSQYLVDHHHTLLHNGYWLAWLIHVGESLYAMALCKASLNQSPENTKGQLWV